VTLDNISAVVDAGIYTWDEICQGAEDTETCQGKL
jgi:D-xylose transport system substrate-binding protein